MSDFNKFMQASGCIFWGAVTIIIIIIFAWETLNAIRYVVTGGFCHAQ